MAQYVTITSTPIRLTPDGESDVFNKAESRLKQDFEGFALDEVASGTFEIHFSDEPSSDKFVERVNELAADIGPLLLAPCEVSIQVEDDGDFGTTYCYVGPTPESIATFEQQCILKRALECLSQPTQSVLAPDSQINQAQASLSLFLADLAQAGKDLATIKTTITVFMLAENSEGVPEMLRHDVVMAGLDCDDGDHLNAAKALAYEAGYTRVTAFDERDSAARAIDPSKCYTLEDDDADASTPATPSIQQQP